MEENQDIYSYGFDKSLNKTLPQNSTEVVYDAVSEALNAGQVLSGGNLNLKSLSIGGLIKQVAPGDDIQAAIDVINREGGGTVQLLQGAYKLNNNINLRSNVHIKGAGKDVTVLDFQNTAFQILTPFGDSLFNKTSNFSISYLTIRASTASGGALFFHYSDFWLLDNIKIKECAMGMRTWIATDALVFNCNFDSNTSHGFAMVGQIGGTSGTTGRTVFLRCSFDTNDGDGYNDSSTPSNISGNTFISCSFFGNVLNGLNSTGSSGFSAIDCVAEANEQNGFNVGTVGTATLIRCRADTNTVDGFNVTTSLVTLLGCRVSSANTVRDFDFSAIASNDYRTSIVLGSTLYQLGTGIYWRDQYKLDDAKIISMFNGDSASRISSKNILSVLNNETNEIREGSVVVHDSTSTTGDQFKTTTTNGNNKVMGMAMSGLGTLSIGNNRYGYILTEGYTSKLFVTNGTSSIAVGDWLSTYSHAYYAKEAVSGDTVFAIALETPTTSTAQIKALLVSPRLI